MRVGDGVGVGVGVGVGNKTFFVVLFFCLWHTAAEEGLPSFSSFDHKPNQTMIQKKK